MGEVLADMQSHKPKAWQGFDFNRVVNKPILERGIVLVGK
jgi:hypothetical protein